MNIIGSRLFSFTQRCRAQVPLSAAQYRDHPAYTKKVIMEYIVLSETGQLMPTVGLGTWQASPDVIESVVTTALKVGYRHIDTAFNYNNEDAIGKAIRKWLDVGGIRNDLFVTTKENFDLYDFVLNPTDMESLESLDRGEAGRIFNFLFWKGVDKHPEYPFKLEKAIEKETA